MPLLSKKQVLNLKLSCIPLPYLKVFAKNFDIGNINSGYEIIKKLINIEFDEGLVDNFIKQLYLQKINERRKLISDDNLKNELLKVKTFSWGVIQGQLDQKIQAEYVRKFYKFNDLINNVKAKLHDDITNYVICSWFNHWTTVLIEEHISSHSRVIPTIKNVKGVDLFFDGQPFDLKVTYIPRGYDPNDVISNPSNLIVWMYENQGAQRFGADNRLFVVLLDKKNPEKSWELKRNFELVFEKIDEFFDKENVSKNDEIVFSFGKNTYTAVSKMLLITNE